MDSKKTREMMRTKAGRGLVALSRTSGVPHSGQTLMKRTFSPRSAVRAARSTPTILGMISPPFSTYTWSPICRSSPSMMSALWSDARLTVVPASRTGSRFATGVTAPVRPTWKDTESRRVSARSAWNL